MSNYVIFFIMIALGASSFAVMFRTPRKYFLQTVMVAFLACYLIKTLPQTLPIGLLSFFVATIVGCLSHFMARITSIPAQSFLIPGIIFLVPGTYIYRFFASALNNDMASATHAILGAIAITMGISFGLLLANWLVPSKKSL